MAAQLAPLRTVSSIPSDSDEDDTKNDDDDDDDEDSQISHSSTIPTRSLAIPTSPSSASSGNLRIEKANNCQQEEEEKIANRDHINVNAPLESMEGPPLSRQSDDFGNYPMASTHQNVNSMHIDMSQQGLNGGPMSDMNYASYNGPHYDYGQPQSSATYTNDNISMPVNNNNNSNNNDSNNQSNHQRPEQVSVQTTHMDQMPIAQHPQVAQAPIPQQRPYVPTYPVKTVDPMSQYGQGIRNVAQLPPNISKPINQNRKPAAQRNQLQKKPESLESLRVDLEVAKKVSQIMSATKQQKLAAESQQKSTTMQAQSKPMVNCTNCNKMFTTARNLQRHRQTCVVGLVGSPSNNPMPPPLTPSQMATTASSPSPATFQMNPVYPSPSPNQGYMSNGYEYKVNGGENGYSDWSRSESYSGPQSVGPEMDMSDQMLVGDQMMMDSQKQDSLNPMDDRQKLGFDSNVGMPLSLDVDEQLAPSSSASMSSNSQSATPASYMCESCKKTVSSLRSLRRHHNTCKLYAAEFGLQTEDGKVVKQPSPSTKKAAKRSKKPDEESVSPENEQPKKEAKKKKKSALLEALEAAPRNEVVPNIYRAPPPPPIGSVASTSAAAPTTTPSESHDQQPGTPFTPYAQYCPPYSTYQRSVMGPPLQCYPTPSPTYQSHPPSTSSTPHQPLPSINSSLWFSSSSIPTPSSSSESTILSPAVNSDSKTIKKQDADTTQSCDCGGEHGDNKDECDHGYFSLPRTGSTSVNQCEDCNRQLCSASNLKRHRATCKAVMQKLSGSTPTSQPATPAAPQTPLSTNSSTPLPVNVDTLSPSVSKSGSSSSSAWSPEKKLTSPRSSSKSSANYLITSEPAASKPWITVGEHLKAQHVQQQKMQQKVQQQPHVQMIQQMQPTMGHHMQNQQQSQNKFGIVELKNNASVHITSQPLLASDRSIDQNTTSSFVSTFSDFGSDDELDDIDMDAFDEEMQRGAEMFHLEQEAQLKAEAERRKNNIVDRRSLEDYTITTVDTSKYAGFKGNQQRANNPNNSFQVQNPIENKKEMTYQQAPYPSSSQLHPISLPSLNVNTSTAEKTHAQAPISLPTLSLNSCHEGQNSYQNYSMMSQGHIQQQQYPQMESVYRHQQQQQQEQMQYPMNTDNMQMQRNIQSLPPISLSSNSQNTMMEQQQSAVFNEPPKKKRVSKSKEKTPMKKEKAESIVTTIDSSSKIEVSDQTSSASPLDSIITSEPLPVDVGEEEKYSNAVVKPMESAPIEVAPLLINKQRKAQEFQCPECLKIYSCRKNVKRHRSAVHKLSPDEIAAKPAIALPIPIQPKEETAAASGSVTARRHTLAGSAPTSKEAKPHEETQARKASQPVVNFVATQPTNQMMQSQHQQHQQQDHHQMMQGNSQTHIDLMPVQHHLQSSSSSMMSQSKFQQLPPPPGWNGPPIISSWRRTRSGEYVDEEESKETARIAAELKRSAEEELAEIQGKKPRTELAEADTTFSEDNEKISHHQLMPLSNAILPSLSSPSHDHHQMMGQQMQSTHHIVYHSTSTPSFYQSSSGSMGSSLPSIQSWSEYDQNAYSSQHMHPQQQQQQQLHQPHYPQYHGQPMMHQQAMYQQQQPMQQMHVMQQQQQHSAPHQTAPPSQSAPQTPATPLDNGIMRDEIQEIPMKKKRTYACSGCHKVLSSDYSLRRHRSTCVDVQANRAANEVLKENKKIVKKTASNGAMQKKQEDEEITAEPLSVEQDDQQKNGGQITGQTEETKPVEENGQRTEEVPDSTTSQRHDRSTSPGINGLPSQGSPPNSNSNSSSTPPSNNDAPPKNGDQSESVADPNAVPLPQISLSTTPFQSCGKYYSSEWNLERHKRESCPGREKSPPKPSVDNDDIWLIFNDDDSARMKMSKAQLTSSSPYFAQCIKNYDSHKGEVRLVDCDMNNFRVLTEVMNNASVINEENVDSVVELSKRYQFTTVYESVERYIGEELPRISIMHAIRLAEKYRFTIIKQQLFDSISLDVFRSLSSDQHYRMMDSNLKAELLEKWGSFL